MSRDQRIFDLIQRMRDGRLHTAAELGAAVGVSTRTIWRDMAMMAATGIPVEGERGLGYILRSPLVLPPVMLTAEELEAASVYGDAEMALADRLHRWLHEQMGALSTPPYF